MPPEDGVLDMKSHLKRVFVALRCGGGILALGLTAVALPAASAPAEEGGYAIKVSGYVPVICRATLDSTLVSATGSEIDLGTLQEFCNSPNGYKVYVDHSPELAGATLIVDGTAVPLAENGSTEISTSAGPAGVSRKVALHLPENGRANGALSVRIAAF